VAGALGGAALVFLLGRGRKPKSKLPAAFDETGNPMKVVYLPAEKPFNILGFAPGDLLTLGMIGTTLVRQLQDLRREQELEQVIDEKLPASPAEINRATPRGRK
jgi:hypothetical protein